MRFKMIVILLALFVVGCKTVETPDVMESIVLVVSEYGHGSGSVIGSNMVLTARHVTEGNDLIVTTVNGRDYPVIDQIIDPNTDAAILIIDGVFDVPMLAFSENELKVGDSICVYGTPANLDFFPCRIPGCVLKLHVEINYGYTIQPNMFLLDTHTWAGCSGGPVILDGKIIGLWTAFNGVQNLSFAIPLCEFQELIDLSCNMTETVL